jgi:hypothetical protein
MAAYGSDELFEAWLTENGYALPDGAPTAAVLRVRGSGYIDGTYGPRFTGTPTGGFAQALQWPRTGAEAYGVAIGDTVIPDAVVRASYHAAYAEAVTPGSLSVSYTPGTAKVLTEVKGIKWTVVGDASAEGSMVVRLSAVEGLLAPFLCPVGGFPAILVV